MRRILIYGLNFSPELTGIGKYTGEMARWLVDNGYDVKVVTAPPYYPEWRIQTGFQAKRYTVSREDNLVIYRCPVYVPRNLTTFTRLLHLLSFSLSSLPALFRHRAWRPDAVLVVVPTLFCALHAALFARLAGSLSIVHIQDFEIDALFGLGMARGRLIRQVSTRAEHFIFRRFDLVSTISSGMLRRARAKGVSDDRLRYLPNWSEVERFQGVARSSGLLGRFGINPSSRVVLYAGNIGEKQGLDIIIECAHYFKNQVDIIFLIVGEGADKARLQHLAQLRMLNNIVFQPLQPGEEFPELLASVNCHLVVQRRGAADAVMPSKLADILAVGGNAVITADSETSLGELCDRFPGIATRVEPECVGALVQGIKSAIDLPQPNLIAQSYAKQYLSKNQILNHFFAEIKRDIAARRPEGTD